MPLFDNTHPVTPIAPTIPPVTVVPIINTSHLYGSFNYNNSIITGIDGTPWGCEYYNQYIGSDDVVVNSNDVVDPTLRHYLLIHNFELKVTSALANSITTGTGTATVTGSANVYPVFTPIVGDIFIATIEPGIDGIFEVTGLERSSQYLQSVWNITYSQIGYRTNTTVDTYTPFVVGEVYFDITKLDSGSTPIQSKSEFDQSTDKLQVLDNLISEYYSEYYDLTTQTFLLPNTGALDEVVYDPFLLAFFTKFAPTHSYLQYPVPVNYDYQNSLCTTPFTTLYDAISRQSNEVLRYCAKAMHLLPVNVFDAPFQRHTLRVTSITDVVYPFLYHRKIDNSYGNPDLLASVRTLSANQLRTLIPIIQQYPNSTLAILLPLIKTLGVTQYTAIHGTTLYGPLLAEITTYGIEPITTLYTLLLQLPYVLSNNFYYGLPNQSALEAQLTKLITRQPIVYNDLLPIINALPLLTSIDRFYAIPLLFPLLSIAR